MTPQEALQLLDRVVSSMTMTRQDHVKIIEAVKVLEEAIKVKK